MMGWYGFSVQTVGKVFNVWYYFFMKKYSVYIEKDEDGLLIGSVPSLPGCYSQAQTMDELLLNMREVIALCTRNQTEETSSEFVGIQTVELSTG